MNEKMHVEGKRTKKSKKENKKKIIIVVLIIFVLVLLGFYILLRPKTQPIEYNVEKDKTAENPEEISNANDENIEIVDTSDIPDAIQGNKVIGKIVIDKINISQNVLEETNNSTLKLGVTKFWGPDINEHGNLCLTGHNWPSILGKLTTLEKGDTFYIVGKDGRKITYSVTETLNKVNPKDMSHIQQDNNNIRKVTLITCDPRRSDKVSSEGRTKKG